MNSDSKKTIYIFLAMAIAILSGCLLLGAYQNYKYELLYDYGRWAEAEIIDITYNKKDGNAALYLINDGGEEYMGKQFIQIDHPVIIGEKYPVLYYAKSISTHGGIKSKMIISRLFINAIN